MATDISSDNQPTLVLFRRDLRVADNLALSAAVAGGRPVLAAFVLDEESDGVRPLGAASRWWLHHSLTALAASLAARGARLVLRRGRMADVVESLVTQAGAGSVYWNRRYDPAEAAVDADLKTRLRARGTRAESFDGQLLHEPSRLKTGAGGPYKVYSAFWRALAAAGEPRDPADPPAAIRAYGGTIASDRLDDWQLRPQGPDWSTGLGEAWSPGEVGAREALSIFLEENLGGYADKRDFPALRHSSRLSPHLAFGEITPFQIFACLRSRAEKSPGRDIEKFRQELGWREFSYHLLFHNPKLATQNYNAAFDGFKWASPMLLEAWQRGRTGYPIVDAGMRQLWQTGWMHNRVRMIVASFLIKHLLIDWRHGEAWFWNTLVDADAANNPASWQWVAGSGADAAPYFRIFNPVLQGAKFDADGAYVRAFVPEIAALPDKFLHRPWAAPKAVLDEAGVKLGDTYPVPVVDHDDARQRALAAFKAMRGTE